jgi:ribosomal-protein-alanine N-acetyltransferase
MSDLTIRSMAGGDIDVVMSIALNLANAPQWPRTAYETALDPAAVLKRVAFVAEDSGTVIGFAIASLIPPQSELESIAVSHHCQRAGAGSALLGALIRELESQQITEITLEVRDSNAVARAFYLSHSFGEHARRRAYYADTGEDAVIMRAILPLVRK